ncbi:MAG: polysaccharide deacetylase family protein [Planctomycetota bacterium]
MTSSIDFGSTLPGHEEARLLDHTGQECYRATSANFSALRGEHPLYRPYLDEEHLRAGGPKPRWPNGASFAACLTHDVDFVASRNAQMHWRRIVSQGRYLYSRRDARAVRGLQASLFSFARALNPFQGSDPLHAYEQWLAMEAEVGAKSTFLFLPDRYARRHYTDGGYRYTDRIRFDGQKCSVAEMMREIHRQGWEIGLHASWRAYDCADEMKRQKEQVESAIDAPVESVRHHYLHFDIRRTPRVHHEAGLLVDSSLGFNDNIGFRYGTSYPWSLHDLEADTELPVLELPLIIQDKCLATILGCGSEELAMEWASKIVERVRAVGGVLTVLWHPGFLGQQLYENVYRHILGMLFAEGAYFATMRQIAEIWLAQKRKDRECLKCARG